ncbi:penicillin-binding protein 1B [Maricurvus nonylphenolicus]|uniref:penicillin-binding protein 1B n=1 Tax=Maricurvus nonylphenolicus TaxID=1008307 RepID=UPI0036F2D2D9
MGKLPPMKKPRRRKSSHAKSRQGSPKGSLWRRVLLGLGILVGIFIGWVVYLNYVVVNKFEGHKWSLPAQVYGQPLSLFVGQTISREELRQELETLDYRWVERISGPGQASLRGNRFELQTRGFIFWDKTEPSRRIALRVQGGVIQSLRVLTGPSTRLLRLQPPLIGAISPRHSENRSLVKLQDISQLLGETLLAVEDRDFLDHAGLSPRAIARAFWVNLQAGRIVQGGSTLTQQLVKNFYLSHERSLVRKAQEAIMSLLLEWHYSKAEIFETYLNEVYLGQSGPHGVHGFGLGAQHYFGKPVGQLNVAETALLVGLVKGASYYNPWRHPERAKRRRNLVVEVMLDQGLISGRQAKQAQTAGLGVVPYQRRKLNNNPAYMDLVRRQLRQDYSDEVLSNEGLQIFTAFSSRAQRAAEKALQQRLKKLEAGYQLKADSLQGSIVITDVGTGELLALVGDRNPQFAGFNRAIDAYRPIGSLVKPVVYLAALESENYHWASSISDAPVTVEGGDGSLWQPRNFSRESHGQVPMIEGLMNSYNQATARLGMLVGLDKVQALMVRLGGDDLLRERSVDEVVPAYPAMLLGASSLSPLQVSAIYHSLANDGVRVPLRAIRAVTDAEGKLLSRYQLAIEPVVNQDKNYLLQYGLQAVLQQGTAKRVYQTLPNTMALAGKTGTTNQQRDSWFAGFSDDHLAVVWVGRDDNGQTPLTGASGALPVWIDVFSALPSKGFRPQASENIVARWVNRESGLLSDEGCENVVLLPFEKHNMPRQRSQCVRAAGSTWDWFKGLW